MNNDRKRHLQFVASNGDNAKEDVTAQFNSSIQKLIDSLPECITNADIDKFTTKLVANGQEYLEKIRADSDTNATEVEEFKEKLDKWSKDNQNITPETFEEYIAALKAMLNKKVDKNLEEPAREQIAFKLSAIEDELKEADANLHDNEEPIPGKLSKDLDGLVLSVENQVEEGRNINNMDS